MRPTYREEVPMSDTAPVDIQDQPEVSLDEAVSEDTAPAVEQDQPVTTDEESFTDSYDPESVPEELRPQLELAYKQLQGDYTKKRQSDSATVKEAEQARQIVQGLQDPERAPEILRILGWDLDEEDEDTNDYEQDGPLDPNDRIDALEAQLTEREQLAQQQQQLAEAQQAEEAEDLYVAEQIDSLESSLKREFSQDEVNLLYLYADEYRDETGRPNVNAAHTVLDGIIASRQKEMLTPKASAPRQLSQGQPAARQLDHSTEEGRMKAMEQAAAMAMGSN